MHTDAPDVVQYLRINRWMAAEAHRRAIEAGKPRDIVRTRRELLRAADALLWASWDQTGH